MRQLAVFLVLAWAPVGLAQTDFASFDPVGLGNEWVYLLRGAEDTTAFVRVDAPIEVDTLGKRWVLRRTQTYSLVEPAEFIWAPAAWGRAEKRLRLRLDLEASNLAVLEASGEAAQLYPCSLDLDGSGPCGSGTFTVSPDAPVIIGEDTLQTTVRMMETPTEGWSLASGVGVVSFRRDTETWDLVYAVVNGDTLGGLPESIPHLQTDPVSGWRYWPLAVGNEWHTEYGNLGWPDSFYRRRVTRTEVVSSRTYWAVEGSRANSGETSWTPSYERLVRYDTLSGRFLSPESIADDGCPFDEPYAVDGGRYAIVLCSDIGSEGSFDNPYAVSRGKERTWEQANGLVVTSGAFRTSINVGISDSGSGGSYAMELGFIPVSDGICSPLCYSALTYARVRQPDGSVREIGAVAIDSDASPTAVGLTFRAFPSPTSGHLTLALDLPEPQPVELAAFDALGRRMWHLELAISEGSRVEIDASAWAPGLYFVRALTDDASATTTVVRR